MLVKRHKEFILVDSFISEKSDKLSHTLHVILGFYFLHFKINAKQFAPDANSLIVDNNLVTLD